MNSDGPEPSFEKV